MKKKKLSQNPDTEFDSVLTKSKTKQNTEIYK